MSTLLRRAALALALAAVTTSVQAQRTTKLPGRPAVGPAKPFAYPALTLDTLPNGLRYAVIERHDLPIVIVRSVFAGIGPQGMSFLDPAGKEGAWGILLASLRAGTSSRSAAQITDHIADLGTEFPATAAPAFVPPFFRAARSTWIPSLRLLADLLINPTVSADAMSGAVTRVAAALDRLPPITLANRQLYAALYGQESAYNHFATPASVNGLLRDDVIAMKRDYLGPQNALLVIAGDVSTAEARKAMQESFGQWERSRVTVAPVVPAAPASPGPTTIYLKDFPGLPTPQIVSGQILPGRDNPDAASIEALVSVLGDPSATSGSRVYRAFRLDRGLAYSPAVQTLLRPVPETMPMIAGFAVPATSIDTAVNVWLQVVRDIRGAKPVLASELEFSKNNLVGSLPLAMERLDMMNFNMANALRDRLPLTYLNEWVKRVGELTLAQVQGAATRYLDPEHMPIIVVGDRSKVEAALRATGIPVVVVP